MFARFPNQIWLQRCRHYDAVPAGTGSKRREVNVNYLQFLKSRRPSAALVLGILPLLIGVGFPSGAQGEDLWRIPILHSYEEGYICGQPQEDGLVAALAEAGYVERENLTLKAYHMDTKRKNNTPGPSRTARSPPSH